MEATEVDRDSSISELSGKGGQKEELGINHNFRAALVFFPHPLTFQFLIKENKDTHLYSSSLFANSYNSGSVRPPLFNLS